ncbi:uncharacterized protein KY384_008746 [Bacidia gigantensis]|uniref:uncharacterized protein n=1 Tax=Bacidia gigantensis TaxID=2732470 RepID=UPI001D0455F5|nr:uncharacterized protein KY384_008746 [Bacidia gigantensis]KAG8526545.1 hypothetical protein KY384_008746 [Bacidia gigantensis]
MAPGGSFLCKAFGIEQALTAAGYEPIDRRGRARNVPRERGAEFQIRNRNFEYRARPRTFIGVFQNSLASLQAQPPAGAQPRAHRRPGPAAAPHYGGVYPPGPPGPPDPRQYQSPYQQGYAPTGPPGHMQQHPNGVNPGGHHAGGPPPAYENIRDRNRPRNRSNSRASSHGSGSQAGTLPRQPHGDDPLARQPRLFSLEEDEPSGDEYEDHDSVDGSNAGPADRRAKSPQPPEPRHSPPPPNDIPATSNGRGRGASNSHNNRNKNRNNRNNPRR